MRRRPTATSAFGVSRREGHDASGFYRRFQPPEVSADATVAAHRAVDKLIVGDARRMSEVPDASVALVVTSPPYFAGKAYEEALGERGIPATYLEYLDLLRDVFAECVRTLEPGGRIAVNVANLGRRPYRSLAADVIGILQDDLRLLLRGEIIWLKQRGSSGSCAWGSFQSPANPVLRDLTERVIVAGKGRFDRAMPARARAGAGLPSEASLTRDAFMEGTLDVWEIPTESATRVGHPAPFPVELPARLIDLYTYRGDLVLDPFLGSGSTAVAARRAGRHYVGYDLDGAYVALAEERVAAEPERPAGAPGAGDDALTRALAEGRSAKDLARAALEAAGFRSLRTAVRGAGGLTVDLGGEDRGGRPWLFEVGGGYTSHRPGVQRPEALWRALGRAAVLGGGAAPLVLLAPGRPAAASAPGRALAAAVGPGRPLRAVVDLLDPGAVAELAALAAGEAAGRPARRS
ncbi:MAG TPA: site-specific DNA-methyltransferase [Acidimicrobiales bacterium]|nr:site-specific DNA-methyltransferase [Acidimicrobiales bacterium]